MDIDQFRIQFRRDQILDPNFLLIKFVNTLDN